MSDQVDPWSRATTLRKVRTEGSSLGRAAAMISSGLKMTRGYRTRNLHHLNRTVRILTTKLVAALFVFLSALLVMSLPMRHWREMNRMAASEKARAAIAIELAFSAAFAEIWSLSMVMVVLVPLADVLRSCVSNTPGKNSIVS